VANTSFAGNNGDTTTNLYDAYFREYGIQGSWPSPDPAGMAAANPANPQSWNRYAYALNNPLLFIDSLGLQQTCQTDGQDVPCPSAPPLPPLQCFYGYTNGDIDFEGCTTTYPGANGPHYAPFCGPGGCGNGPGGGSPQAPKPTKAQCVQAAYNQAANATINASEQGFSDIGKETAGGAIGGAIAGCLLSVEIGCLEGGGTGALVGAFGGFAYGVGKALYGNISTFVQTVKQLNQNLAACNRD
jgi:RHS repeat-associated protein